MFVDCVEIDVSSGKGGSGAVSFRREKFVIQGGPDGGDGGRGGNVFFEVDHNSDTLSNFRGVKHYRAENGRPGEGKNKTGKKGEDLIIKVPPGTQVFNQDTQELLLDLKEGKHLLLEGGKGGLGNVRFKNSTNQRPTYAQNGLPGIRLHLRLELKLIADVGLVGFPNVGKSTLISVLSNARPEIANYEFTTIVPNLGVVDVGNFDSFVVADIPGIINGASDGRGLGIEFLRHIERTKLLLFVIDANHYQSMAEQYQQLRSELRKFSKDLDRRCFGVVLSKMDVCQAKEDEIEELMNVLGISFKDNGQGYFFSTFDQKDYFIQERPNHPLFFLPISSIHHTNIEKLKQLLSQSLQWKQQ